MIHFKPNLKIAVDFDGTICTHQYPNIGLPIGAFPVLKLLQKAGARLILDTMRSGEYLQQAIRWCKENGIEFYSIGKDKGQENWTSSNKCHADISIDDRNLGVPLLAQNVVDWHKVCFLLLDFFKENGIEIDEIRKTLEDIETEREEVVKIYKK